MGGDRRAMPTVGRHGTARLRTLNGDRGLSHPPPRLVAAHGTTLVLEWLGHASTPSAVRRLRRDGRHPSQESRLCSFYPGGSVPLPIGLPSAATDRPSLTQDGDRPPPRVLGHTGIPALDSLATKAAVFLNISRALRRRVCSSRRRWSASGSGDNRPWPGNAPCSPASRARFPRPSLVALIPTCRAASVIPVAMRPHEAHGLTLPCGCRGLAFH